MSASLVSTQAATSVLGLAFWVVAARQTSVAAVGVAGAAVALMLLLGSLGMLGLGTLLIAEVRDLGSGRRRILVRTSLATSGIASAALGFFAALGVGALSSSGIESISTPFNVVVFAVGTGLTGMALVLDQAVLGVGLSRLQLERNIVASLVKIAALVLLTAAGRVRGMDIFVAWTIGTLASLMLVAFRTRGKNARRVSRHLFDFTAVRGVARSAASHHVLNLALQAPLQLLSLVVVLVLTAEDTGYFSTALSVAGFVFVLPFSITMALFADAGRDEHRMVTRMRLTIPFGFIVTLVAALALALLGPLILGIFGQSYSDEGLSTLRLLVLAGLPLLIKDHFVALRRVEGRTANAAALAMMGAMLEVGAAVLGAKMHGTVGLCAFWVGALTIEAVILGVPLAMAALSTRTSGDVILSDRQRAAGAAVVVPIVEKPSAPDD